MTIKIRRILQHHGVYILIFCLLSLAGCRNHQKTDFSEIERYNKLVHTAFVNKEYEKAIEIYNQLVDLDSHHKIIYTYRRGLCKSMVNDFDGAREDLMFSIENDYNKPYAYQLLAENSIKEDRDTVSALKYINEAYRLDPENESIIMYKLLLMGKERAFKFAMDSLTN